MSSDRDLQQALKEINEALDHFLEVFDRIADATIKSGAHPRPKRYLDSHDV